MDTEGPHQHESCWRAPLRVPKCLKSRLGVFNFSGFRGLDHELALVKYILHNAKVLKTIAIHTRLSDLEENLCILKKLSEFPRGSLKCLTWILNCKLSLSLSWILSCSLSWLPIVIYLVYTSCVDLVGLVYQGHCFGEGDSKLKLFNSSFFFFFLAK